MQVTSVCIKCQSQNAHDVDPRGHATVTCSQCSTPYEAQTYEVRAKGGRRDRTSGIKNYSIRVKEPDRDETLLQFASRQDIEMRSGDWITGSYERGKLKFLSNHTIKQYWDVRQGMGCGVIALAATLTLALCSSLVVLLTLGQR